MKLTAQSSIQILRPVNEVYETILNPEHLKNYFVSSATGPIEAYKTVIWKFPEFDETFPVTGILLKPNEFISFDWSGGQDDMMVEIYLEPYGKDFTVVKVIEYEFEDDEQGIENAMRQTNGWANFLACLKAYAEYGINLRKGAFDFMR